MNDVWVINGWRQQHRSLSATNKALACARERGMQSYSMSRQGKYFWLVCSRDCVAAYDAALCVRRYFVSTYNGIYLAAWREQWLAIAWRGDQLLHCLACNADADGLADLQLLLARISRKGKRRAAVLLAKSAPPALQDYCAEHLAHWQILAQQPELAELPPVKVAKLRDIQVPTPWQQRRRISMATFVVCLLAGAASWTFWPHQSANAATQAPPIRAALPHPAGVAPAVLQELPELLFGLDHLAGWQWRVAQLQGQTLKLTLEASYGRREELRAQLPPTWQLQGKRGQVTLTQNWPTLAYAQQTLGQAVAEFDLTAWQAEVARLFPHVEVIVERTANTTDYRYQTVKLKLAQADLPELARLSQLLRHPHLRLVALQLQPGKTLRTELELRWYQPLPPATEGES
jgi:hypothetical protein